VVGSEPSSDSNGCYFSFLPFPVFLMSEGSGAGATTQRWKEHMFFIHDQLACVREEDPPENAVVRPPPLFRALHSVLTPLCYMPVLPVLGTLHVQLVPCGRLFRAFGSFHPYSCN
jgi:hypothetical protein